ncbi:hypothetical protein EPO05_05675 [Patescibacteria group bacterium]|nr:MAG: hypothetical protein EPO05_05675 [Patescibacteria group bacterium]
MFRILNGRVPRVSRPVGQEPTVKIIGGRVVVEWFDASSDVRHHFRLRMSLDFTLEMFSVLPTEFRVSFIGPRKQCPYLAPNVDPDIGWVVCAYAPFLMAHDKGGVALPANFYSMVYPVAMEKGLEIVPRTFDNPALAEEMRRYVNRSHHKVVH